MIEPIEGEIWSPIPSCPKYQVSSLGRVIGARGRLLSHCLCAGYPAVQVYTPKGGKLKKVHKLMAEAFLGPSDLHVRHLDGNPKNCTLKNLAYGTPHENMADKNIHGTHSKGVRNARCRLTKDQVLWLKDFYWTHLSARYASGYVKAKDGIAHLLAAHLGVSVPTIEYIVQQKGWNSVRIADQ